MSSKHQVKHTDQHKSLQFDFQEILAPLKDLGDAASHDTAMLQRELEAVDRKFRNVEAFYASSFTRVLELDQQVSEVLKQWRSEVPVLTSPENNEADQAS